MAVHLGHAGAELQVCLGSKPAFLFLAHAPLPPQPVHSMAPWNYAQMWTSSPARLCTYSLCGWLDPSTGQASVHRASETFLPSLSLFLGPHIPGFWPGVLRSRGVISACRCFWTIPQKGSETPPLPLASSANCFSCKGGLGG